MKFFEIDEEYLKKGGLITRDKKSDLAFGIVNNRLVVFNNSIKKEPEEIFKGYASDLLADDWQYVGFQQNKTWYPKDGESFYFVTADGEVTYDRFLSYAACDNNKVQFHNIFKTQEEAKKMLEKLKIINRLRELANINFGNDGNQLKYSVSYDIDTKKVRPVLCRFNRLIPFEVYFKTEQDCRKAINTIGEENLKKYYFDVVE